MSFQNFGGNEIKQFELGKYGKEVLGSGPYEYFYYQTLPEEDVRFDELGSFTVYIYSKSSNAKISVDGISKSVEKGDCIQSEGSPVIIQIRGGEIGLLVAGTYNSDLNIKGINFTKHDEIYKVIKPWGHELWLNGQHQNYAIKEIFIKAGTKTSLQFHNFKQETNVLFDGSAKLHFKINSDVSNHKVTTADTSTVLIKPVSSVDVLPKTLHRLEAITDILLFETSTPHLDDVVRVLDDNKRPDGRLETEHLS